MLRPLSAPPPIFDLPAKSRESEERASMEKASWDYVLHCHAETGWLPKYRDWIILAGQITRALAYAKLSARDKRRLKSYYLASVGALGDEHASAALSQRYAKLVQTWILTGEVESVPYDADLFTAPEAARTKKLNNAPGGYGGVDYAAQVRLGKIKSPSGTPINAQHRQLGICCGITTAWMMAVRAGIRDALDPALFAAFFEVLRFQGAYMKDAQGNAKGNLADAFFRMIGNLPNRHYRTFGQSRLAQQHQFVSLTQGVADVFGWAVPDSSVDWMAYGGLYAHAIGVAHVGQRWYIMDPNHGLFVYHSERHMLVDLQAIVRARRAAPSRRPGAPSTGILAIYYV